MRLISILIFMLSLVYVAVAQTTTGDLINNNTSTTVGADSDATGNGDVNLQTRGLTGFRLLNNGNAHLFNRLGINTPNPLSPIHIKVTYPDLVTSSQQMIRFESPQAGRAPFLFYLRSTLFGDDPMTNSVGWGFNADNSASSAEPSLGFLMEDTFGHGDEANFELHLQLVTSDTAPASTRPWTWTFNRKTGITDVTHNVRSANWGLNGAEVHFRNTEALFTGMPFRVRADSVSFETLSNGGAPATQISIQPIPSDHAISRLVFGNVSVAKAGTQGLAFYREGDAMLPAEMHAYRYYGYGSAWGSPMTMIGDRIGLSLGKPIMFSSTALPDGSSDVRLYRLSAGVLMADNPTNGTGAQIKAGTFNVNNAGSYQIGGTKILGAQCGSIANSIGGTDDTRAINQILACLRSHGLLAP